MKKKLLIVSYYFPPHNFVGAYRAFRFVRYLHRLGWEIKVLSSSGPEKRRNDPQLLKYLPDDVEVIRVGSLEGGEPSHGSSNLLVKFARNMLDLLLFPDKKVFWAHKAEKAFSKLLSRWHPDVIMVTAPPYSSFSLGLKAVDNGIPWVADFRDAWSQDALNAYHTPLHLKLAQKREAVVIRSAHACTFVNEWLMEDAAQRYPYHAQKFVLLPNGYDSEILPPAPKPSNTFTISYLGTLYGHRTPEILLSALSIFRQSTPDAIFHVNFVGRSEFDIARLARLHGIPKEWVTHIEHTSYFKAAEIGMASTVLWLIVSKNEKAAHLTAPGKLYDYIGFMRPILASVPHGVVSNIVSRFRDSVVVSPDDVEGLARAISELYRRFLHGQLNIHREAREHFSIKRSTEILNNLLKTLITSA